jgi:cyclophilin family peptidyl-prolyl cis-trans isomerase
MIRRFLFVPLLMSFLTIISAVVPSETEVGASEIRPPCFLGAGTGATFQKSQRPKQMDVKTKKVKLETTMGDIVIELNEKAAPVTVKNFLVYVNEGFFDGTIFHRVIPNFMIQGGGFTPDMVQKKTHPPIINEANNGLKNNRGTIAMARTPQPDSATSQFFINHKDNPNLNYVDTNNPGYAVFGKVIDGMETVDKIAAVKTTHKGRHADVPVEPIVIKSANVISDK